MFTEIEARSDVTWQPSLLGIEAPTFDRSLTGARRRFLGAGAWVDHVPRLSAPWGNAPASRFDGHDRPSSVGLPVDRKPD